MPLWELLLLILWSLRLSRWSSCCENNWKRLGILQKSNCVLNIFAHSRKKKSTLLPCSHSRECWLSHLVGFLCVPRIDLYLNQPACHFYGALGKQSSFPVTVAGSIPAHCLDGPLFQNPQKSENCPICQTACYTENKSAMLQRIVVLKIHTPPYRVFIFFSITCWTVSAGKQPTIQVVHTDLGQMNAGYGVVWQQKHKCLES